MRFLSLHHFLVVRRGASTRTILCAAACLLLLPVSPAQTTACKAAAGAPDPSETTAGAAFTGLSLDAQLCTQNVTDGCAARTTRLKTFQADTAQLRAADTLCAFSGQDSSGQSLSDADKGFYSTRADFWSDVNVDMALHSSDVLAGTYKIPSLLQTRFLGILPDAAPPSIKTALKDGVTVVSVIGQPVDTNFPNPSTITICVWTTLPASGAPLDCQGTGTKSTNFTLAGDGSATVTLDTALKFGQAVSVSEASVRSDKKQLSEVTPQAILVGVADVPRFSPTAPLGAVLVGLDLSGASSTDTKPVFLATAIMDIPLHGLDKSAPPSTVVDFGMARSFWASGLLRVAGIAQPGDLTGKLGDLGSAATYLASAVNATPDAIVQSVEASASLAWQFKAWQPPGDFWDIGDFTSTPDRPRATTLVTGSLIATIGAITPLSASQANPPVYSATNQIIGDYNSTNGTIAKSVDFPSSCTYTGTASPTCFVAFVPVDRSHFYRHYEVGFRFKLYANDNANHQYRFPGYGDLTFGQNEYVTGGKLRGAVMHVGGALPIPHLPGAYTFGSMDLGLNFSSAQDNPQLILSPAASMTPPLTYLSPQVYTIPVDQPNRDRYRLGFGLDIFGLITAFRNKTPAPTTPTISTTSASPAPAPSTSK